MYIAFSLLMGLRLTHPLEKLLGAEHWVLEEFHANNYSIAALLFGTYSLCYHQQ